MTSKAQRARKRREKVRAREERARAIEYGVELLLVACPKCDAKVGDRCQDLDGLICGPHPERGKESTALRRYRDQRPRAHRPA